MDEQRELLRRVARGALWLVVGGGALLAALGRWQWALGFAVGGGISLGNFSLIARAVAQASGEQVLRPARVLRGSLFRLGLTGLALFLVVIYLPVNLIALASGLLAVQVVVVAGAFRWGFQVGVE
ncbi:MAG TPA: ATP synthase subunit I [Candidatus Methylomirabilis sp.]|nr:ATP synthase subunit I [Candidatus Methylomirabilis sp.]